MKIFAISDLHLSINSNKPMDVFGPVWENYLDKIEKSWLEKVTENDIVLIAGDISWAMKLSDAIPDLEYISKFPGKKIIIRGNHDYWWGGISSVRKALPKDMFALQNDAIKINDIIFCGTRGWTVPEKNHKAPEDEKIYNRELLRLELSLKEAKKLQTNNEQIVALIHFPPFNSKLEDSEFTSLLETYGVKTVVYGHLHAYDIKQKIIVYKNDIKYYLTSCDLIGNDLIEIV